ncbi:MAG: type VI secretion system tube protein Hcp [Planctomycetes bacterium]|nr:type VI secretion system tube protein Hcp [Planctomycetota bacterium]
MKKLALSALAAVLIVPSTTAFAADTVYMKIEGVSGEIAEKGLEGCILVEKLSTDLEKSTAGKITSKLGIEKRPRSLTVLKALDKATPRIAEKVKDGSAIGEIKLQFFRKAEGGEAKLFFTMSLKNATLVSAHIQVSQETGGRAQEELSIDYEDIELVSEPSGEKYLFKK